MYMNKLQRAAFNRMLRQLKAGKYASNLINLSNQGLEDNDVTLLINAIKNNRKSNLQIKTISIANNNIYAVIITGLLGLESLDASDNKLSTLALHNLPNFRRLNASYNRLSSINLNSITGLEELILNGNHLTAINLTKNTQLQHLELRSNFLHALNLAYLTKLHTAIVHQNSLSSLLISGAPLNKAFTYDHNSLDALSLIQVAAHKNLTINSEIGHAIPSNIDNQILTSNLLVSHFSDIFSTFRRRYCPALLIDCKQQFLNLSLMHNQTLPHDVIFEIINQYFRQNLSQQITSVVNTLLASSEYNTETDPNRKQSIIEFANNNLPAAIEKLSAQFYKHLQTSKAIKMIINRNAIATQTTPPTQTYAASRPLTWLANRISRLCFNHPKTQATGTSLSM